MTTSPVESPSRNESSVSDWDDLAPATTVPDLAPAESRPDAPLPGTCQACGDPIIREPGARGRMPKYHPDCRPKTTPVTGGAIRGRSTKADAEALQALAALEGHIVKGAIMLSMVDRYDAFCVMVGWSQVKPNLLEVLKSYPGFRKEMLALQSGGSILGLILSIIMVIAPIAAHHGLIPGKHIAQVLVNAPFMLHKIQQKLSEGAAGLTQMMEEQLQAAKDAAQAAKVTENSSADPTPNSRVNGAAYGRP